MKTIVGMFWGVMAGLFLASGVIVITQLIYAGSNLLGFSEWTFRYYVLCLGVCIALLICSTPARKHWRFMFFFIVAVFMVMGIGFQAFLEAPSGQDRIAQMQAHLLAMCMLAAKGVMYIAPGALTAFYAFVAFDGVSNATAHKPLN